MTKQLGELVVADYMTAEVITVEDTERLTNAIRKMNVHKLSAVPVVDQQGRIVGILSSSDLIEMVHEIQSDLGSLAHVSANTQELLLQLLVNQGDSTLVRDAMTTPVETALATTNIVVAARRLVDRRYHHLPVVDDANQPVGIISSMDFVRAIADYGALLAG
ncbi:MAG TPA: CBS domain-containing protein [Pirellulaceae bacterium]|nr:CBS domain-containing protein [Pirellulaceae bacterium]HMO92684.1 CBS domain-containing protein [Pirellulaceae bacterium]HMP70568.1 CBS domain-containing protein [Pirellulaceae bacterium]